MRVLAFGAHPDDLEIFCYGLLACFRGRGDDVHLAVASDGAAGVVMHEAGGLAELRAKETMAGLHKLGVPMMLGLADGQMALDPKAGGVIAGHIQNIKPDLIITHDAEDYHPDHRALSRYVTAAAGFTCPILYCESLMGVGFMPEIYVDITAHFEDKKQAILAHHSQRPQKFVEAMTLHNRFRAAQCNAPAGHYAECYRTQARFPFADLRSLLPPAPPYRRFYDPTSDGLI